MPATKRSRKSGAKVPTKKGRSFKKAKMDDAMTDGKRLVFEEEKNMEQMTQVEKPPKANQTSERWTPYFNSKRLHSLSHGEAIQTAAADGDDEAKDSMGLETAAMQVCVQLFTNNFHTFWKIRARRAQHFGLRNLIRGCPCRNVNPFAAPPSMSSDLITNH